MTDKEKEQDDRILEIERTLNLLIKNLGSIGGIHVDIGAKGNYE